MENHVTNLEISKKLKELGVKQESEFHWMDDGYGNIYVNRGNWNNGKKSIASAFLASELGELLPQKIIFPKNHKDIDLKTFKNDIEDIPEGILFEMKKTGLLYLSKPNGWIMHYMLPDVLGGATWTNAMITKSETLPNAMGKMLIYLIEHDLLTPNTTGGEEK